MHGIFKTTLQYSMYLHDVNPVVNDMSHVTWFLFPAQSLFGMAGGLCYLVAGGKWNAVVLSVGPRRVL